jgi:hypothetical protein
MTLSHSGASELNQLMEGTTAGALIPEIVRRGFQDLLEAEVSALTGAQLHERCPDQRSTHRNGYRRRLLTTQVGDLTLAIPKLRHGSFFPDWLEPRRRVVSGDSENWSGGDTKTGPPRGAQQQGEQGTRRGATSGADGSGDSSADPSGRGGDATAIGSRLGPEANRQGTGLLA